MYIRLETTLMTTLFSLFFYW